MTWKAGTYGFDTRADYNREVARKESAGIDLTHKYIPPTQAPVTPDPAPASAPAVNSGGSFNWLSPSDGPSVPRERDTSGNVVSQTNLPPSGGGVGDPRFVQQPHVVAQLASTPTPPQQNLNIDAIMQSLMQMLQPSLDSMNQRNTEFAEWQKQEDARRKLEAQQAAAAAQAEKNTANYNQGQQSNASIYGGISSTNPNAGRAHYSDANHKQDLRNQLQTNRDNHEAARNRYTSSDVWAKKYAGREGLGL